MLEADVLVVGAGPAGAAFALNLASWRRVLVVDRQIAPGDRIGESLVPAARRLLGDMGLWESFLRQGHAPAHGVRSVWGGSAPVERGNLHDLDGAGWHLDRTRFDRWLRDAAAGRGAAILIPASPRGFERLGGVWHFWLGRQGHLVPARCRLIVDAGGRGSAIARGFGAVRLRADRLVCGWLHGADRVSRQSGLSHIEAEPDGWWYTAPLPNGRRVLAFHTDADLPAASAAAGGPEALVRRAATLTLLPDVLQASGFAPAGATGFCAAHSSTLSPSSGDGWLAVGDAALAFDPLSSQGLFNALYTGLAAAEATDRALGGDEGALRGYRHTLEPVVAAYRAHLQGFYGLERRWAERPFWQRRLG